MSENLDGHDEEFRREVSELADLVGNLATNHRDVLARHETGLQGHERDMLRALESLKHHADCISVLRADLLGWGELVNEQSRLLTAVQSTLLKVLARLGMDQELLPPPSAPN